MKKLLTVLIICLLSACASQNKQSAEVDDPAMRSGVREVKMERTQVMVVDLV